MRSIVVTWFTAAEPGDAGSRSDSQSVLAILPPAFQGVKPHPRAFASRIACRSESAPLSALVVTAKMAAAATIVNAVRRSVSTPPVRARARGDVTCGPIPPQGRQRLDIDRARV